MDVEVSIIIFDYSVFIGQQVIYGPYSKTISERHHYHFNLRVYSLISEPQRLPQLEEHASYFSSHTNRTLRR